MASLEQNLDIVAPHVDAFVKSVTNVDGNPSQLLAKGENIIKLLFQHNLGYDSVVQNRFLRPHNSNRSTTGLDPFDVHCLIEKIIDQGWVASKTAQSICFEAGPDPQDAYAFNNDLWRNSDSMLAPMMLEDLRYLTVAGSHTVAGLNAVDAGCATFLDQISTDGRLSLDKCRALCAEYADAVVNGFSWRVLRWQ
eukprot:8793498-Pyramimonas_sp.AAC.1